MGRKIRALIAFGGSLALVIGLGAPATATTPRIVGGAPIAIAQVPWQVNLNIRNTSLCSASIIGTQWLVTAAHCVAGAAPSEISAYVGVANLGERSNQNRVFVSAVVINPGWNANTFTGDIALLQLSAPLTFSPTVQAISLPITQDPGVWPAAGTAAQISGWGSTSYGGTASDALLAATVSVIGGPSDTACGSYGGAFRNAESVCAGVPQAGIDTCQGDSGGPLIVTTDSGSVLAGVTSVGKECALPNFPGIYTRVTSFLPWINEYVPPLTSTPNEPLNLIAISQSRERVLITWDVPNYDGGLVISNFVVSLVEATGELTPVCTSPASPCVVTNQKAGSVLAIVVQAANELGEGTRSAPVGAVVVNGVRTPPAKVTHRLVAKWAGVKKRSGVKPRVRISPASRGICTLTKSRVKLVQSGLCVLRVTGAKSQKGSAYLLGR
ncbi:MAG: trypsin-like serine protease [Candidatus Nanopelagicales bacterium]|nr:trypsin-like serine protease [Candidatus Nanopelagicales bacterium]